MRSHNKRRAQMTGKSDASYALNIMTSRERHNKHTRPSNLLKIYLFCAVPPIVILERSQVWATYSHVQKCGNASRVLHFTIDGVVFNRSIFGRVSNLSRFQLFQPSPYMRAWLIWHLHIHRQTIWSTNDSQPWLRFFMTKQYQTRSHCLCVLIWFAYWSEMSTIY